MVGRRDERAKRVRAPPPAPHGAGQAGARRSGPASVNPRPTLPADPFSLLLALPTMDIAEGGLNKLIGMYKDALPEVGG